MKIEWYRELQAKPLDEWIEHPRVVAGEAADEIERLEAERDAAIEEIKLVKSSADYHKSQDCMAIQNEIIAQRDEAWARIAVLSDVSRIDILREWFGGERYARDYEYLDANFGVVADNVVAWFRARTALKENK